MQTQQQKAKVVTSVSVLAALLMLSLFAIAGDLEPSAPPGPTMKTLDEVEPRILIKAADLPLTISEPNSYYLAETINFSQTNTNAITIEANDVTIDLAGFSLIGPGKAVGTSGTGIRMGGRSNVEIRNGTVRDFRWYAICEYSSSNGKEHRVINVRAMSNGTHGILLYGYGHLVKDCTAAENGISGIFVANGCTVTANTAYNNQDDGISTYGGCTIVGNTVYENQRYGINASSGCTITGNTVCSNQQHGIIAGSGCTVIGNTAYYNQRNGIYLVGNSLVDQNTAYNNDQAGLGNVNMNTPVSCTFGLNHAP